MNSDARPAIQSTLHRRVAAARLRQPRPLAGSTNTHPVLLHHRADSAASLPGRQYFSPMMVFIACRSKSSSATSCFSRRFSSSRAFSRSTSPAPMPPYFDVQRKKVCSLIPSSRQNSVTFSPAPCCFKTAAIRSGVCRLRLTISSPPYSPSVKDLLSKARAKGERLPAQTHRLCRRRVLVGNKRAVATPLFQIPSGENAPERSIMRGRRSGRERRLRISRITYSYRHPRRPRPVARPVPAARPRPITAPWPKAYPRPVTVPVPRLVRIWPLLSR